MGKLTKIGIIPARYASTRFPGKPLIDIAGKSMIQRVYEQSCKANLDKVIVATDDERIYNHVEGFGGAAVMTSALHQSGTDRCAEVIDKLQESYDVVVNIQGDEPLIEPELINSLVELFNDNCSIGTLIKKSENDGSLSDPNRIKVVKNVNNKALYFSRSLIPFNRNDTDQIYYRHIGIYAFKTSALKQVVQLNQSKLELTEGLEQLRWLENGYDIMVKEVIFDSHSIDAPADVEHILKHLKEVRN